MNLGPLLFIIYTFSSWILLVYAANFYYLLYLSVKNKRIPKRITFDSLPTVTVQLPIYNERYVASRLISTVCSFEYPKERLQIQVLDDSTDDTLEICKKTVEFYHKQGFRIEHITRQERIGFKAGALKRGLETAEGDFIAIFDADFLPPGNFLQNTLQYFSSPDIGLVQARWGHINGGYSHLTEAQALNLDLHFHVEQKARSLSDLFMNFNGTAGVWRKKCIQDAGGWEDTLAEDLDLSYRAQFKGWRFIFLPDLVCPAELPVQINAVKRQQFRWAKGAIQCTRKFAWTIIMEKLSMRTKIQAFIQLTRHIVHPILLLQFLLIPILMHLNYALFPVAAIIVEILLGPAIYIYAMRRIWRSEWISKLGSYFTLLLLSGGISVNNTRAVLEGITDWKSDFLRTPKFGVITKSDRWRGKQYVLPFSPSTIFEFLLGTYGIFGLLSSIVTRNFILLPYLGLTTVGFYLVAVLTILHSPRKKAREKKEKLLVPPVAITLKG